MNQAKAPDSQTDSRIDKVALRRSLGDRLIGHRLLYFLSIPSTNRHVRELAEDGWPEGTIVMAEEQTAGAGRSGRIWHSPPGVGLYLSVLLKPEVPGERLPLLTLLAALSAARGLRDCGHEAEIKWPNDLLLAGRKIGGILAETRVRPSQPPQVVLGLGINVNHREEHFPPELRQRAGSLRMATGRPADRTAILTGILLRFDAAYADFRTGDDAFIEEYVGLCPMARGATISVTCDGEMLSGRTSGIGPNGTLRLATDTGVRDLHAGDVTLTRMPDAARG